MTSPAIINRSLNVRYTLEGLAIGDWATLGRVDAARFLPNPIVSRFHATIIHDESGFYLVDHSLNGTWFAKPSNDTPSKKVIDFIAQDSAPSVRLASVLDFSHSGMFQEARRETQPQGNVRRDVTLDRSTYTTYVKDLKAFQKSLKNPKCRANCVSLGRKLEHDLRLGFGSSNCKYICVGF